jgi:hypothetical protein
MTTEYEKQLEEEIVSLKTILDVRTKELDDLKSKLDASNNTLAINPSDIIGSGFNISQIGGSNVRMDQFGVNNSITNSYGLIMENERLTPTDIANLHHLWSIHMQKENNPPLLYKLWRRITSCLTTKKN